MKKLKRPLIFTLIMLPIAVIAGILVCLYQLEIMSEEVKNQMIAQMESIELLIVVGVIQTLFLVLICSFVGFILSEKTGLWKPVKFDKKSALIMLISGTATGLLLVADYFTFGNIYPLIKELARISLTPLTVSTSILYGGIIEEILMRLFVMTLISFILWKLFSNKSTAENIPEWIFITANIIAALMFAAGHIPATINIFGTITPLLLLRCFLLNGAGGYVFGVLYRKYGICYAMGAHALAHIVSKLIYLIIV